MKRLSPIRSADTDADGEASTLRLRFADNDLAL